MLLHIRSSGPRAQSLKRMCKDHGLTPRKFNIDIKYRYNITYTMLQSIEGYKESIITWMDVHGKYPSIRVDWTNFVVARLIMDCLEVFS